MSSPTLVLLNLGVMKTPRIILQKLKTELLIVKECLMKYTFIGNYWVIAKREDIWSSLLLLVEEMEKLAKERRKLMLLACFLLLPKAQRNLNYSAVKGA